MLPSYNAVVVGRELVTAGLMLLRVRLDRVVAPFKAGQFATLGMLSDAFVHPEIKKLAPTVVSAAAESNATPVTEVKLVRRAYSIASGGNSPEEFEFYITLVPNGLLTPKLFSLNEGDRMYVAERVTGHFVLTEAMAGLNLVLIATGTGLSPYISMLRDGLLQKNYESVTIIHGVRTSAELGYRNYLEQAAAQFKHIHYVPVVSRPHECASAWSGRSGRIPHLCKNENLLSHVAATLDATRTHYFLCGNSGMIDEMIEFLTPLGFVTDKGLKNPGTIHKEEYF